MTNASCEPGLEDFLYYVMSELAGIEARRIEFVAAMKRRDDALLALLRLEEQASALDCPPHVVAAYHAAFAAFDEAQAAFEALGGGAPIFPAEAP